MMICVFIDDDVMIPFIHSFMHASLRSGRLATLKVHTRSLKLDPDVDLDRIGALWVGGGGGIEGRRRRGMEGGRDGGIDVCLSRGRDRSMDVSK